MAKLSLAKNISQATGYRQKDTGMIMRIRTVEEALKYRKVSNPVLPGSHLYSSSDSVNTFSQKEDHRMSCCPFEDLLNDHQ